jgi:hypothetical protein
MNKHLGTANARPLRELFVQYLGVSDELDDV